MDSYMIGFVAVDDVLRLVFRGVANIFCGRAGEAQKTMG
jgi:hypothetical protein